jgi:hypothetical protein
MVARRGLPGVVLACLLGLLSAAEAMADVAPPVPVEDGPICKILEATRNAGPHLKFTTYQAKVEYKPSKNKTVKSITIEVLKYKGKDAAGNPTFEPNPVKTTVYDKAPGQINVNGGTSWYSIEVLGNDTVHFTGCGPR